MSVIVKDPRRCDVVCFHRLKNSCCHPCCPPLCCYPVPPSDDPFFSCCKRIPPECKKTETTQRDNICPPDVVAHSGPLPCRACYECASTACCPQTFAGSCSKR